MEQGVSASSSEESDKEIEEAERKLWKTIDAECYDTSVMTRKQVAKMYEKNASPRMRSTKAVVKQGASVAGRQHVLSLDAKPVSSKKLAKLERVDPVSQLSTKQTFAHSLKTRAIVKNNFGMPYMTNARFLPVNKTEAKGTIFRQTVHDHEVDESLIQYNTRKKNSTTLRDASPRSDADPQKMIKGLSDPMFASKLDRMEKLTSQNASKISLGKMMYDNKY